MVTTRAAIMTVAIVAVIMFGAITADPTAIVERICTAAMAVPGITTATGTSGDVAIAGTIAGMALVSAWVSAEGITVGTADSLSASVGSWAVDTRATVSATDATT